MQTRCTLKDSDKEAETPEDAKKVCAHLVIRDILSVVHVSYEAKKLWEEFGLV